MQSKLKASDLFDVDPTQQTQEVCKNDDELQMCNSCYCMTKTCSGKCGKCGNIKEKSTEPYVTDSKTPELTLDEKEILKLGNELKSLLRGMTDDLKQQKADAIEIRQMIDNNVENPHFGYGFEKLNEKEKEKLVSFVSMYKWWWIDKERKSHEAHLATELDIQRRELEQKHHDRLLVIKSIVMQSVVLAIENFAAGRPKEAFEQLEGLRKYGKERLIKKGAA